MRTLIEPLWVFPPRFSGAWVLIRDPQFQSRLHRVRYRLWRSPGPSWTLVGLQWRTRPLTLLVVCSALFHLWLLCLALRRARGLACLRLGRCSTLAYPGCLLRSSIFLVPYFKSSLSVTSVCYSFISVLSYKLG